MKAQRETENEPERGRDGGVDSGMRPCETLPRLGRVKRRKKAGRRTHTWKKCSPERSTCSRGGRPSAASAAGGLKYLPGTSALLVEITRRLFTQDLCGRPCVCECVCSTRLETVAWRFPQLCFTRPARPGRARQHGKIVANSKGAHFDSLLPRRYGFLPLLLELQPAEHGVGGERGPGRVRGGVARATAATLPALCRADREERRGGAD